MQKLLKPPQDKLSNCFGCCWCCFLIDQKKVKKKREKKKQLFSHGFFRFMMFTGFKKMCEFIWNHQRLIVCIFMAMKKKKMNKYAWRSYKRWMSIEHTAKPYFSHITPRASSKKRELNAYTLLPLVDGIIAVFWWYFMRLFKKFTKHIHENILSFFHTYSI